MIVYSAASTYICILRQALANLVTADTITATLTTEPLIVPEETLFSKIIRREIPADILFQDDLVTVFRDINPVAPTHVLIVPNKHIPTADDIEPEDEITMGRMLLVAKKIAREEGISDDGYRLIINCKEHGNQEVMHIHMHLIGGRPLGFMIKRDTQT